MSGLKFERYFAGRANAGLRAAIREAVSGHCCGIANAAAVIDLAPTVALTAAGRVHLEAAAADYRAVGGESKRSCDCARCYAGNLQLLGALG